MTTSTPPYTIDHCRSCNADIIWAVTTNARPMPVDAQPVAGANVALQYRGTTMKPLARVLSIAKQFGRKDLRLPHHASCPHGQQWRTSADTRRAHGRRRP